MLRKAARSGFSPRSVLAIGTRRVWASSCSVCTGALQVIARAGNQLQTCSTSGRMLMVPEKPCVQWPHQRIFLQVGRDPARAHLRKATKLASGSCVRESETFLGDPSSAQMRVCSGKQCFGFSPSPLLVLGPRSVWAASSSLCTGALLVLAGAGNQLQPCSPLGRRQMGPQKALCALAPEPHIPPAREGPT